MFAVNEENILMIRDNLNDISDFPLPEDFCFRYYQDGDIQKWLTIQTAADKHNTFSEEGFYLTFNNKIELLKERMFFIFHKTGQEIATSTAWHENETTGLVHWVAVIPEYQGQGLSKPLLAETLGRMVKPGYKKAVLRTKPFRISAINLYLKFGFKPYISSCLDNSKWQEVIENFKKQNLDYSKITPHWKKFKATGQP